MFLIIFGGGDDLVLQVGGPVSGFWIGYLAGLATLPAVAVLVFLGLVVSALLPAAYGWECCCCGETIITERDSHPVPGLIAWARFRAHRLITGVKRPARRLSRSYATR